MIVQHSTAPGGTPERRWTCLARRGMLHSECEAVDLLTLEPGAAVEHRPDDGVEEAMYVVDGAGTLTVDGAERTLSPGWLALLPHRAAVTARAGTPGLRLLTVRVLPRELSQVLPTRVPELPVAERTATA